MAPFSLRLTQWIIAPPVSQGYAEHVKLRSFCLALATFLGAASAAHAITIRISAQALERTLQKQLFKGPEGRYYMRGHADRGCYIYASEPQVSFRDDRVVVHVKTHAKFGTSLHGECLGIALGVAADVSLLPDAEGETIGFREARVENLSQSKELNVFLEPFLSRKLPQEMKVNAADLVRQLLSTSAQTTGYDLSLGTLTIHSMAVQGDMLLVDLDGDLTVH